MARGAVDAVNGPSRSGPRAAPSGDSRGHAGVSMASSLSISLARCVLALDRSARPLPSRAAARAARPAVRRSSACPAGLPVGARSVAADVYGSHAASAGTHTPLAAPPFFPERAARAAERARAADGQRGVCGGTRAR